MLYKIQDQKGYILKPNSMTYPWLRIALLRWISILALGWRIVALLAIVVTPAVLTVLVVLIRARHDECVNGYQSGNLRNSSRVERINSKRGK